MQLLLKLGLLPLLLGKALARLLQLFLLLHCDLLGLLTDQHLLLHLLELLEKLLLLGLGFLLFFLLLAELVDEALLFLSLEIGLILDHLTLLLSLLTDFLLFSCQALFELPHLFSVLDNFSLWLVAHNDTVHAHDLLGSAALVKRVELLLQLGNLLLVLAKQRIFGVLINAGLVLDILRSGGVTKRVHRLVEVVIRGAHIRNHHCLCVAAQRVLQETGELTVAVRDVRCLGVGERGDNVAERGEREINLGGFLETVACSTGLRNTFRAGQIHHVELADANVLLSICAQFRALNSDREERVRARGVGIHLGFADRSVLGTDVHDLAHFVRVCGCEVGKVFDVDTRVDLLMELKSVLRIL